MPPKKMNDDFILGEIYESSQWIKGALTTQNGAIKRQNQVITDLTEEIRKLPCATREMRIGALEEWRDSVAPETKAERRIRLTKGQMLGVGLSTAAIGAIVAFVLEKMIG